MNLPENLYKPLQALKIADVIYTTQIEGLYYIEHSTFKDQRGFFSELARLPELEKVINKPFIVKQISQARSEKNVVRGIHGENWNKYISVASGVAFSVIVDLRPESPTFKKKEYFILGYGENALDGSLYIPARCGNSMCVLESPVNYIYFFDTLYRDRDTSGDIAISLFDPDLDIKWPIPREEMVISQRDVNAITLREKFPEKVF